jgi:hypothetical protein
MGNIRALCRVSVLKVKNGSSCVCSILTGKGKDIKVYDLSLVTHGFHEEMERKLIIRAYEAQIPDRSVRMPFLVVFPGAVQYLTAVASADFECR